MVAAIGIPEREVSRQISADDCYKVVRTPRSTSSRQAQSRGRPRASPASLGYAGSTSPSCRHDPSSTHHCSACEGAFRWLSDAPSRSASASRRRPKPCRSRSRRSGAGSHLAPSRRTAAANAPSESSSATLRPPLARSPWRVREVRRRGEGETSLTHGLYGTMLTFRLTGTTEATGSTTTNPTGLNRQEYLRQRSATRRIFAHHGAPPRRHRTADLRKQQFRGGFNLVCVSTSSRSALNGEFLTGAPPTFDTATYHEPAVAARRGETLVIPRQPAARTWRTRGK